MSPYNYLELIIIEFIQFSGHVKNRFIQIWWMTQHVLISEV